MMGFRLAIGLFALAITGTTALAGSYSAGGYHLPHCDASNVMSAVAGSMKRAQQAYQNGLHIAGLSNVKQSRLDANGPSAVARRYCRARATLSDGRTRTVYYMVEQDAAFVGIRWDVESCVAAADKWRVYGNHCSTVRPR
ncbi:putative cytoplasmic protein [Roseibium sp. TrichSKD4]|uniref:hypothetical protein n=1 Tax=Roseibium sp. TrichSKD4 TaxID=744980 RepID=UPI0001E568B7|nr:hypothetical protein [Roseibium sp. TrichSKD4]EFO31789.1 putative cytoplasmic protein [Roseibium sp. TrichSKD4]